jgi:hypothetical protein
MGNNRRDQRGSTLQSFRRLKSLKADSGRFDSAAASTNAVTRGLDPRVHYLRIELFAKKMDCRVKPGNDAEPINLTGNRSS